jgi:Asp-tRNA(Asn)/Glu-tRNA(Gln) amidotransferase A subunit family amidase
MVDMIRFQAIQSESSSLALVTHMDKFDRGNSDQPMGVQLVAARSCEDVLLAAAADIEARNAPLEVSDPD